MLKPNSLYILGAASSPGFPLGSQLKLQVASCLSFRWDRGAISYQSTQQRILDCARTAGISDRRLVEIGRIVSAGVRLASSIDNYLELKSSEPDLVSICKTAIADTILTYESNAGPLRGEKQSSLQDFDNTWYQTFAQICFQSCRTKDDVPTAVSRFTVVSFNYDRCFEQFLRIATMRLFSVTYEEAIELTSGLTILHPYGSLGRLPDSSRNLSLGYGQQHNLNIANVAQNIRTFTEQIANDDTIERVKSEGAKSETIVFSGFGYHKPNLEILAPHRSDAKRQIVGTCDGLSEFAQTEVTGKLERLFRRWHKDTPLTEASVKLEPKKCSEFLDHFRLALVD